MNKIGYFLVTAGFIFASLVSVTNVLEVNWFNFILSLAVCLIGIFFLRRSHSRESLSEGALTSNIKIIEDSLSQLVSGVKKIRAEINPDHPQDVHHKIDATLTGHLQSFVESRKAIAHIYGLNDYADVMNFFATGERYLNRVWSASTDGYIDEVTEFIKKSEEQFEGALNTVKNLN